MNFLRKYYHLVQARLSTHPILLKIIEYLIDLISRNKIATYLMHCTISGLSLFFKYPYKLNAMDCDIPNHGLEFYNEEKLIYSYGSSFPFKILVQFYEIVPNTPVYRMLYKKRIIGYNVEGMLKVVIETDTDPWW